MPYSKVTRGSLHNTIDMKTAVRNVMARRLSNQAKGIEAHALRQVYTGINKKLHYRESHLGQYKLVFFWSNLDPGHSLSNRVCIPD